MAVQSLLLTQSDSGSHNGIQSAFGLCKTMRERTHHLHDAVRRERREKEWGGICREGDSAQI